MRVGGVNRPPEEIAVAVEPSPTGGCLLRVSDRGKGMDEDAMRRAALPLSSADRGGSGLGLPLCAEILSAHGGDLVIGSRPGGGTVVTCRLPEGPPGSSLTRRSAPGTQVTYLEAAGPPRNPPT